MKRELTCIICPRGCALTAEMSDDGIKVTGNTCPKGEQYAKDECTHPVRTVTSTVRVTGREDTMVSVKTKHPIPKEKTFEVMSQIRKTAVLPPVKIGDIIIKDVCGTDIIATKDIE